MFDRLPLDATAFLILFARVGAVLMLLPVFSEDAIPPRIRLLAAGGMTLGLWGLLSPTVLPLATRSDATLAGVIAAELGTGLALGLVIRMMFLAISIAGSIISLQVGLSSAVLFDPAQSSTAPELSRFFAIAAAVVCMASGVHHLWIDGLVRSYAAFPVGSVLPAADFATLAVRVAGETMTLGVSLAAPLIVYGIVFNMALGLAARVAPTIQLFFIAQPLNLLLGLGIAASTSGAMLTAFAAAMAQWMQSGWS
ncbi:flagellar biosynthetic protein FliR [Sphingomonas sp. TREG-RG-20F-R18-01]|uniref:flagellar biosynthetic protein FliR n=1 Tax=Sphingomonas sp. TREG-RG-20F-R18-01 TaxID=2914982 RepID=UPI001F566812|nr:flagellar biosynthetic protein FliR [Sphingomonas sp. TREG-RG-20F-R18-01]